jgi:hypothetical protein
MPLKTLPRHGLGRLPGVAPRCSTTVRLQGLGGACVVLDGAEKPISLAQGMPAKMLSFIQSLTLRVKAFGPTSLSCPDEIAALIPRLY